MAGNHDVTVLRDLAQQYTEVVHRDGQDELRDLWRRHNSLQDTRPLILAGAGGAWQEVPGAKLECEDPFFLGHEYTLRNQLCQASFGDDTIFEPWITQRASLWCPPGGHWGLPVNRKMPDIAGGSWKVDPPIKSLDDAKKMVKPRHALDEDATERNVSHLHDTIGDILEVNVDRSPLWQVWAGDLSTDLAYLRGLDQMMLDMMDNPVWLHELLAFMRDGILAAHEEAERAGDWRLANHGNQAMTYALELEDPRANSEPVTRDRLWIFLAAQEYELVSPAMHDEFLLQYQIPIMEKFGLSAYGCCENLTQKIDILRQIPNLRRIGVTPRADVWRSAEQIGRDYVISWRPNPAEMMCCGFNPDHVREVVKDAMEACRGCVVDIHLKDVQTVQGNPGVVNEWVQVVREVTEEYAP
jgi:hypothetical protein